MSERDMLPAGRELDVDKVDWGYTQRLNELVETIWSRGNSMTRAELVYYLTDFAHRAVQEAVAGAYLAATNVLSDLTEREGFIDIPTTEILNDIRALAPADATAALEKLVQERTEWICVKAAEATKDWGELVARLTIERDEARAALRKLRNEICGCLGISGDVIRKAVGNTNYACLEGRVTEADVLLGHKALGGTEGK